MKRTYVKYHLFEMMAAETHTLIAGVSGSGKSVIVNGIIYNLLLKDPREAQLILIDPKRTELNLYENTKHCIGYYSETEPANKKYLLNGLNQAMNICEARYKTMQKKRLRQYDGSHIYVIVDELADLFTTHKEAKKLIQRLNQIGRAANIHVIGCTQTPISKVIPSEIKINFTCRIGLRCNNRQESRNVADKSILETFPRYGQCLYMSPEQETIYKVPMYPESELVHMAKLKSRNIIDILRA